MNYDFHLNTLSAHLYVTVPNFLQKKRKALLDKASRRYKVVGEEPVFEHR